MTDKQLSKLNRKALLEILIAQEKENESLRYALAQAEQKVNERDYSLKECGSIAEASLALSGVFSTAQAAADDYLEKIRLSEQECLKMKEEAQAESERILSDAHQNAEQCENEAKEKSVAYWNELSTKLEQFYEDHKGLKELLQKIQ